MFDMKVAVVVNTRKPEALDFKNIIDGYLSSKGVKVELLLGENYSREDLYDADAIVSIGGDGTMLRIAGVLRGQDTPIFGVNAGHLGYLTEVSKKEQIPEAMERLIKHDYIRDVRSMLHGSVRRNGEVIARGIALNEILVSRRKGISVMRFAVSCDGQELSNYISDGIIFATPTGSTAYNLSAGGPIVAPGSPVIVMTPICAHSTNSRPVVLADSSRIQVRVDSDNEMVAFDGEHMIDLEEGDIVTVRKANEMTTLIKLREGSFLETLKNKMDSESR